MNRLTDKEFHATFCDPMKNITGSPLLVDVWEYADKIIDTEYHDCTGWDWRVEYVHETGDRKYQHISIPVPKDDTYLVLVLSLKTKIFFGHHILDLSEKYGLNET